MREWLAFSRRAGMSGVRWLYGVLNVVGTILLVFALVAGVVVGVSLLDLPAWLVVLVLAALVLVVFAVGAYQVWKEDARSEGMRPAFDWQAPRTSVIGKAFVNEKVVIDGHSYVDCTFDHVTLVFLGERGFDFGHNKLAHVRFEFEDPAAEAAVYFLTQLGFLRENVSDFPALPRPQDVGRPLGVAYQIQDEDFTLSESNPPGAYSVLRFTCQGDGVARAFGVAKAGAIGSFRFPATNQTVNADDLPEAVPLRPEGSARLILVSLRNGFLHVEDFGKPGEEVALQLLSADGG